MKRKRYTEEQIVYALKQAAKARAVARWVFPVPLLPISRTFSRL